MCIRDSFKAGAIEFAWDLLTSSLESGGYGLDGDKLWATVYHDDDEAADLWAVSYTHLRAHETVLDLVCRLLLEKKQKNNKKTQKKKTKTQTKIEHTLSTA